MSKLTDNTKSVLEIYSVLFYSSSPS